MQDTRHATTQLASGVEETEDAIDRLSELAKRLEERADREGR
jgi:hypothetical protein